jgi:hypothetical protein
MMKQELYLSDINRQFIIVSFITVIRLRWLGEPSNFKAKLQRAAFISRHKGNKYHVQRKGDTLQRFI